MDSLACDPLREVRRLLAQVQQLAEQQRRVSAGG